MTMPLLEGKKNVGRNVGELMHAWGRKGKIGHNRPENKAAANRMAVAIALKKAGMSRNK